MAKMELTVMFAFYDGIAACGYNLGDLDERFAATDPPTWHGPDGAVGLRHQAIRALRTAAVLAMTPRFGAWTADDVNEFGIDLEPTDLSDLDRRHRLTARYHRALFGLRGRTRLLVEPVWG